MKERRNGKNSPGRMLLYVLKLLGLKMGVAIGLQESFTSLVGSPVQVGHSMWLGLGASPS